MMEKTEQGLGRLCVIGDPVEHSKSPLIQNAMIAKLGILYHYTKRLVHQGDTQEWLDTARREGFAGFNATMPHKVALVPLMDELGEDARLYGAVNTVCIRGKRCIGHNTDGMGFYQALTDLGVEVPGRRITLLGAGGAAKAVALKLVQQGAGPITVCNRTPQKAEALCNLAKGRMGHIGFALEDLRRGARDCDILINCTSLGMTGTNSQFRDLSFLDELPGHAAVFDLIYSPAETELLRQFYQAFVGGAQRLDNIAGQFARTNLSEEERKALVKEYTDEYYRIRREQLRFIIENKSSLAAVYALYQRLPGDTYLFNGDSDVVYYRTVAEALEQSYPDSPYLQSLLAEITRMDARISLTSRISEAGYPDLELSDIYGKKVRLSSLTGKVVLLDFWSAELGNSNTLNAELKEVYKKYADAPTPFEVYQVAVDSSKPLWITAVQEQQLPWISVSDLRGQASTAPRLYNVQKLPANFLIDREGTIVAKDIYGKSLERKLDELTK